MFVSSSLPDIAQQPLLQATGGFCAFRKCPASEPRWAPIRRAPAGARSARPRARGGPGSPCSRRAAAPSAVRRARPWRSSEATCWLCDRPQARRSRSRRSGRSSVSPGSVISQPRRSRQLAHGLLRVRVAARAAGVVQRGARRRASEAVAGRPSLQQHVPYARARGQQARIAQRDGAGGAAGDDLRRCRGLSSAERSCSSVSSVSSVRPAQREMAPQQPSRSATPPIEAGAQVRIGALRRPPGAMAPPGSRGKTHSAHFS